MQIADERVFRLITFRHFNEKNTISDVIRILQTALAMKPPYVHLDDIARYQALLSSFVIHKPTMSHWGMLAEHEVEALPITKLEVALTDWIESSMWADNALAASMALDASELIMSHVSGRHFQDGSRIEALLPDEIHVRSRNIATRSLKSDITRRTIGGAIVRVRIPDGEALRPHYKYQSNLTGGRSFIFTINRCHLSQAFGAEYLCFTPVAQPGPDIGADFAFPGHIHMSNRREVDDPVAALSDEIVYDYDSHRKRLAIVPFRWFTHVARFDDESTPTFTPSHSTRPRRRDAPTLSSISCSRSPRRRRRRAHGRSGRRVGRVPLHEHVWACRPRPSPKRDLILR